ncbi:restriction endonuclease, partial [Streptomyces inhibens]
MNTQPSKDEGADAIAMNTDPITKGLCIIQAKRTKNVVPFETVSALAGVVEHKRAAKGILVSTAEGAPAVGGVRALKPGHAR